MLIPRAAHWGYQAAAFPTHALLALQSVLRLDICWAVLVSPPHPLPCPLAVLGTTSLLRGWLSATPKTSWRVSRAPCGGGRQL